MSRLGSDVNAGGSMKLLRRCLGRFAVIEVNELARDPPALFLEQKQVHAVLPESNSLRRTAVWTAGRFVHLFCWLFP